jgi:hypothetical protein
MTVPNPEKLKLNSGTSPVKMSQTASNSIPRFRVIFIGGLPCLKLSLADQPSPCHNWQPILAASMAAGEPGDNGLGTVKNP